MSFLYIPIGKGLETIVDADVSREILLMRWRAQISQSGTVHAVTSVYADYNSRTVGLHQMVLNYFGPLEVDHKDRNGLNNRRENLRVATRGQNSANRVVQKRNKTGYKGTYIAKNGSFFAAISINGKTKHIGTFSAPEEAARAYDKAAFEAFGEFAYLNFPDDL